MDKKEIKQIMIKIKKAKTEEEIKEIMKGKEKEINKYIQEINKVKNEEKQVKEVKKINNKYSKKLRSLIIANKKLIGKKRNLVKVDDPIIILGRENGDLEVYHNVKEKEWKVPNLPEGEEKTIRLGKGYQYELPYGKKVVRIYWCHENYAYPFKWGKTTAIKDETGKLIEVNLELAMINSKALYEREKEIIMAKENYLKRLKKSNIGEYIKLIGWSILGIIALIWAYNKFIKGNPEPAKQVAEVIKNNATTIINATKGITI